MDSIQSVAGREFDKKIRNYFNSAALGVSPLSGDNVSANAFSWDEGVHVVRQKFGKLIGQPSNTISVFHNTTAAVQRILLLLGHILGKSDATLLMTDLEYPGIVSAVDETWTGRVVMAEIADLAWIGEADKITSVIQESVLLSRPGVVYLSHVARSTGYQLNEEVVKFIRTLLPNCIIVVDGAQACGNVSVDGAFLANVDFYVTSGHKWLCGAETLGLVYADEGWGVKDPAQSYSMTRGSTGTGSRDAILSLHNSLSDFNGELTGQTARDRMTVIEEHNGQLSKYFLGEVLRKGLAHPNGSASTIRNSHASNGIATIVFDASDTVNLLRKKNIEFTPFGDEPWRDNLGAIPPGRRYLVNPRNPEIFRTVNFRLSYVPKVEGYPARFCFHYYHSQKDVDHLVSLIVDCEYQVVPQRARIGSRRKHRSKQRNSGSGH